MTNRRLRTRLEAIESSLRDLSHQLEIMKTVLVVKEPESAMAANAFEGLRKQIVAVAKEHWAHLAQLAAMDVAINHVTEVHELRRVSKEWLDQAGVLRVDKPSRESPVEMYETLGHGSDILEIIQPAYVDSTTGRIIKAGRLKLGDRTRMRADTNAQEVPEDEGGSDGSEDFEALGAVGEDQIIETRDGREEQQ